MRRTARGLFAVPACATRHPLAATLEQRLRPCLASRGENGQSATPETPSLGAQTASHLLIQIFLFREKLRTFELMNDAVARLSDADLSAFADAIAKLPAPQPPADSADAARLGRGRDLVHKYRCDFCHSANLAGRDNVPRIATQREDFLVKALGEYKATSDPATTPPWPMCCSR